MEDAMTFYCVRWEVDGCSGVSYIYSKDILSAKMYFAEHFGRYGYELVSIELIQKESSDGRSIRKDRRTHVGCEQGIG